MTFSSMPNFFESLANGMSDEQSFLLGKFGNIQEAMLNAFVSIKEGDKNWQKFLLVDDRTVERDRYAAFNSSLSLAIAREPNTPFTIAADLLDEQL